MASAGVVEVVAGVVGALAPGVRLFADVTPDGIHRDGGMARLQIARDGADQRRRLHAGQEMAEKALLGGISSIAQLKNSRILQNFFLKNRKKIL
jgi:hypothetical protein